MTEFSDALQVVTYDPRWPALYAAERDLLLALRPAHFLNFEHFGSTAIPGQQAKPIIDMMASVERLSDLEALLPAMQALGYQVLETGMRQRLFLRKQARQSGQMFHLHVVEQPTWEERKERWLRDYLLSHPEAMRAYGEVKAALAVTYARDPLGYTRAKTTFIQGLTDQLCDERGLPRFDVWEDGG